MKQFILGFTLCYALAGASWGLVLGNLGFAPARAANAVVTWPAYFWALATLSHQPIMVQAHRPADI